MSRIEVLFRRLAHAKDLPLPAYQSEGAAGMDLQAAVPDESPVVILPGRTALIPTGFEIALPSGTEGQVRPRSGLAVKYNITVLNAPGTIDSDYRGELKILLINHGAEAFAVSFGMRIAQLVIAPVAVAEAREVSELDETRRGSGGFGSSGLK